MSLKDYLNELFYGRILYDELSIINESLSLNDQADILDEDLLQVAGIDKQYLLDVGWHQEFDVKGYFRIVIIKDCDWQHPIFLKNVSTIEALKKVLLECKLHHGF